MRKIYFMERGLFISRLLGLFIFLILLLGIVAFQAADATAPESWQTETVDNTGSVGTWSSLALDSGGYPHISYYDSTNGDLKYAFMDATGWHIQTVDSSRDVGWGTSIALDNGDYPHISYYDNTDANLKYARWTGSSWQIETVDNNGSVGQYTSLALDGAGNPHISYWDESNILKYAYWTGSSWDFRVVFTGARKWNSLALDSNGYPHISFYTDQTQGFDLRYASWTGTGWDIQFVDSGGDGTGQYNSLVLDGAGDPHISYCVYNQYLFGCGAIKYAYWTGSGWDIQNVSDPHIHIGEYSSLALDSLGNPHITYMYYFGNGFLQYAYWDGTRWVVETVDDQVDIVTSNLISLAIDGDDVAHISYHDLDTSSLKYAVGTPEDCPAETAIQGSSRTAELETLRQLRDEVLAQSPVGKTYIDRYYSHASELTAILVGDRALRWDTAGLIREFIPGIRELLGESNGQMMVLTRTQAARIQSLLTKFAQKASPGLQAELSGLSQEVNANRGMTLRQILLVELASSSVQKEWR